MPVVRVERRHKHRSPSHLVPCVPRVARRLHLRAGTLQATPRSGTDEWHGGREAVGRGAFWRWWGPGGGTARGETWPSPLGTLRVAAGLSRAAGWVSVFEVVEGG